MNSTTDQSPRVKARTALVSYTNAITASALIQTTYSLALKATTCGIWLLKAATVGAILTKGGSHSPASGDASKAISPQNIYQTIIE